MSKRLLFTAVGLGSSLALLVMPMARAGTAGGQGAQKRGLFSTDESSGKCDPSGKASPSSPNGFAILNAPGKVGAVDNIVGEVSLKDAQPNTTYMVELAMGGTCMPKGMITTNGQGNANFHIQSPGTAGKYYVVLRDMMTGGSASFASDTVSLI